MPEQWEYFTTIVGAFVPDARKDELEDLGVDLETKRTYSPERMMPKLNDYGKEGWELVHMQPVAAGENDDILCFRHTGTADRVWTHLYFCAFKRRKPAP